MARKLTAKLDLDYNPEGDVLDIFLGKPYDTLNIEFDLNITLRLDPQTKQLVGLILHDYSEMYPNATRPHDRLMVANAHMKLFERLLQEKKLKEPVVA